MAEPLTALSPIPKRAWTKERIHAAFKLLFAQWERDDVGGKPAGKKWNHTYVAAAGGRNLLRAIAHAYLTPEIFLRQIGGPAFDCWSRGWYPWDPERERELLLDAHARWKRDPLVGNPAGKRFNVYWLEKYGYRCRAALIDRRFRGGMQAFVRTVPVVYADWSFRRRVPTALIRRRIRRLHRAWLRDPRGRLGGMRFGWMYLRMIGERGIPTLIQRRGYGVVFRGRVMLPVRRAWGRRITKSEGGH